MKRLGSLVLTVAGIVGTTVAWASPAVAAPVGGCPGAFELRTVASLQAEAVGAPDSFFTGQDANGDGFLCNKYLPETVKFVGLAFDNKRKLAG